MNKELEFFDALKEMGLNQAMIQVTEIKNPYYSKGIVLCWDKNNDGRLINFKSGRVVDVCKPLDGTITKWIVKDKEDLSDIFK